VLDDTPTALAAFGAGALSISSPAFAALVPGVWASLWNRRPAQVVFLLDFSGAPERRVDRRRTNDNQTLAMVDSQGDACG
jgi:hypothetical protein